VTVYRIIGWERSVLPRDKLKRYFIHENSKCAILRLSSGSLTENTFGFRVSKLFVTKLIWTTGETPTEHVFHFMAWKNAQPDEHANVTWNYVCACVCVYASACVRPCVCIAWFQQISEVNRIHKFYRKINYSPRSKNIFPSRAVHLMIQKILKFIGYNASSHSIRRTFKTFLVSARFLSSS
jgi:hypothetical protein